MRIDIAVAMGLVLQPGFVAVAGAQCSQPVARIALGIPSTLETGPLPDFIAIGDFEGDGLPDIATGCSAQLFTVHRNQGRGEFAPPRYFRGSGYGVQGLAAGDLDGDGIDDLVAGWWILGAHSIGVYHGGGAPFTTAESYRLLDEPTSVAIGDMDGDGLPDIVASGRADFLNPQGGSRIWILRNRGAGRFDAPVAISVGNLLRAVVLADFDADGRLDFAALNDGGSITSVFVGHNQGSRQFLVGEIPLDAAAMALAAGDLDGDAIADMVVVGMDRQGGSFARVLRSRGDRTFEVAGDLPVAWYPSAVVVGDMDGDAVNDFVVANSSGPIVVSVYRGLGGGSFEARADWPAHVMTRSIALGDLDQDGTLDLATANWSSYRVAVWPNRTPIPVEVDVRPGDPGNHVSSQSAGRVPVAILGSEQFDAHDIEFGTVRINGTLLADDPRARDQVRFTDVDRDQHQDAVFMASAAVLTATGDGCVDLEARLRTGRVVAGRVSLQLVGSTGRPNAVRLSGADLGASGKPELTILLAKPGVLRLAVHAAGPGSGQIELFNVRGTRLTDAPVAPGRSEIELRSPGMGSGVYFLRLTSAGKVTTQRVAITR